jgi:hypothetical protein
MLSSRLLTLVPFLLAAVEAGTIVWDGRFKYARPPPLDFCRSLTVNVQ